jgi:hypothetical protein
LLLIWDVLFFLIKGVIGLDHFAIFWVRIAVAMFSAGTTSDGDTLEVKKTLLHPLSLFEKTHSLFLAVLFAEPRVSHMLGRCSAAKLYHQPI